MGRIFTSEPAIYGTVLVTALVAVGWEKDTDLDVLIFTLGTVAVFWLAHVYSGTVALTGAEDWPVGRSVWRAVRISAGHSVGMLLAMLIPALFLLLATIDVLEQYFAYYLALWVGVVVLAVIGYVNAARRKLSIGRRVVGAAITASLGVIVIALSVLVH